MIIDYKYVGIGGIIMLLITTYLYMKYSKKSEVKIDEKDVKNIISKVKSNDNILKSLLGHTIKYLKKNKYDDTQLLDKLNKDSLFNKDYDKVRILIDTHNMEYNNFDDSKYTFYLNNNIVGDNDINDTGGFGNYKNIIGFKFINAIMPIKSHVIDDTNNIVIYNASNSMGITKVTIILKKGRYSIEELGESFPESSSSENITIKPSTMNKSEVSILRNNISYDSINQKYTFRANDINTQIKFLWKENDKQNSHRLLGFYKSNTEQYSSSIVSQKPPDLSTTYVDLIVNEIPYKSCKNNPSGYNIIERIPLNMEHGANTYHEATDLSYDNYFTPISLNKLSIELRDPTNGQYYKTDSNHSIEFELTMIKNSKNVGLI